MRDYSEIRIILKDAKTHKTYNTRIMDYLNDRHTILNDNKFFVLPEIVDDTNINDFVMNGVESLPAMSIEGEDYIYGANSIIATLAQLEQVKQQEPEPVLQQASDNYYDIALQNLCEETDDSDDNPNPTSDIHKNSNIEEPVSVNDIETKMKQYSGFYSGDTNLPQKKRQVPMRTAAPTKITDGGKPSVSSLINNSSGYDDDEKKFLMQMMS